MEVNQLIDEILDNMLNTNNSDFKLSKKEEIIDLIEREELIIMEKQWPNKRVNMVEFIKVMIPIIHHKQNELLYLVMGLIELFKDIVALSQQTELSLSDVTNFITQVDSSENVMVQQYLISDPKKFNLNKTRVRDIDVNAPRIIGTNDRETFHIFQNSLKNDSIRHHNGIVQTGVFCNKHIVTLDSLDSKMNIYTIEGILKKTVQIQQTEDKETIILSFAWSDRQQRFGLTLKSHALCMYEGDFKKSRIFSTVLTSQEYQTNIWFLENQNQWITTDCTQKLYFWDLLSESSTQIFQHKSINGNIIECVEIVHLKMLATASLDKQVVLWDINTGEFKLNINLKDDGGIHSLVYSYYYQVFITCGYSTYINLYNINSQFYDVTLIGKLAGHSSMLTSILMIGKMPVLVSGDDNGTLRLWDIRTFQCLQSLNFGKKTQITKIIDMCDVQQLCFLGSRLNILKLDIKKIDELENYAIRVEFDQQRDQLIVATRKSILFLDIYTGKILYILNGLQDDYEDDITQFKPLNYFNKFIISDSKGSIRIYQHSGEFERQLRNHQEINVLKLDILNKLLITACQDSLIIQKINGEILRELKDCDTQLMELSIHHSLIILSQGKILYYLDYEFLKCIGALQFDQEITSLNFIANYPICCIATSDGKVYFIKFEIKDHNEIKSELFDLYDIGNNNYLTEETEQEFIIKIIFNLKDQEFVFATSESNIIRLQINFDTVQQTEPINEKINYNPFRKVKEKLQFNEPEKIIIPENFTCLKHLHIFKVSRKQIICLSYLQLDQRLLIITTIDGLVQIFDLFGNSISIFNVQHPLPIRWNLKYTKSNEIRKKIIYAFKVIDILRKQSKSEREAEQYSLQDSLIIKQLPKTQRQRKPLIMKEEFSPRDLKYKKIRHLYQSEVQGPTLKQLEAQRRVLEVQNMFKDDIKDPNIEYVQKQKEREKQKAQDRAINLQFLDPEFREKQLLNTKYFENNKYLKELNYKFDHLQQHDPSQHSLRLSQIPTTNRNNKTIQKKKSISDFYQYAIQKNLLNEQNTQDTFGSQSTLRLIGNINLSIGSSQLSNDLIWHETHRQQQKDLSTVLQNLNHKLRASKNSQMNEPILKDISGITYEDQIDQLTKRQQK